MHRTFRSWAAALALPLLLLPGRPAAAANADVFVLQGSGTVSPAQNIVPGPPPYYAFSGTVTVVGTDGILATYGCSFQGGAGVGNFFGGVWFLSGGCGPIQCATWVVSGGGTQWHIECAEPLVVASMDCTIRYHQTLPVESYDVSCMGRYVRIP